MNIEVQSDLGPIVVKLQEHIITLHQQIQDMQVVSDARFRQSAEQLGRIEAPLSTLAQPSAFPGSGAKRIRSADSIEAVVEASAPATSSNAPSPALRIKVPQQSRLPLLGSPYFLQPPSPLHFFHLDDLLYDFYFIWF